jgi:hypothetical protein
VATIIEGWPVSDGYDYRVLLRDGRTMVLHSSEGEPVDPQAWVDEVENDVRLREIAAARRRPDHDGPPATVVAVSGPTSAVTGVVVGAREVLLHSGGLQEHSGSLEYEVYGVLGAAGGLPRVEVRAVAQGYGEA